MPEFTIRNCSIEGTSSETNSAMVISISVGAPKLKPRCAA
ncbi:Uncharacterised protein [Vibrio cholerae]|nr:Uncharacterised protein [Vibrio cholerae]CSI55690.1 Uncharacterised protein [Vibrio cholerae]